MPIYEVQGPDGKVYEFDAPDPGALEAAVAEAFGSPSNSPVTTDEPSFMQQAGNFAKDLGNSTMTMINEGLNAATFGLTGQAERLGGGAIASALSDDETKTYDDFVREIDASNAQRRRDYPISAVGGSVAGAVIPAIATGGANIANQTASTMLGKGAGRGIAGRAIAAAGFGGAENAAIEAGRGNVNSMGDLAQDFGLGAAFGVGGQLVGEAVEPITRLIGARLGNEKHIRRGALERLGTSLMDPTPGPGNIASALGHQNTDEATQALFDAASRTGGQAGTTFGETSDDMLRIFGANVADPQTIGRQGPTKELAEKRLDELSKGIRTTLRENLIDAGSPQGAQAAQTAADVSRGKALYEEIFDSPQAATTPVITKDDLITEIYNATDKAGKPIFDLGNASPTELATWNRLKRSVEATGGKDTSDLTVAALQKFKLDEVDRLAYAMRNPSNASQNLSSRTLNSVRTVMDDIIESVDPRYAEARQLYAAGPEAERAAEFGRNFIKGTNKTAPVNEEVLQEIATMPARQRLAAQEEALDYIIGEIDQSDNFLKKLATDNPAMLQRIDALFGTSLSSNATNAEDVLNTVAQMASNRKVYKNMLSDIDRNIGQGAARASMERTNDITDIGRLGAATAMGYPFAAANSARRLSTPNMGADSRLLTELLQAPSPLSTQRLLDEIMAARIAPNASPTGAIAGAGAAAGAQSIMDIHRQR